MLSLSKYGQEFFSSLPTPARISKPSGLLSSGTCHRATSDAKTSNAVAGNIHGDMDSDFSCLSIVSRADCPGGERCLSMTRNER